MEIRGITKTEEKDGEVITTVEKAGEVTATVETAGEVTGEVTKTLEMAGEVTTMVETKVGTRKVQVVGMVPANTENPSIENFKTRICY